MENQLKAKLGDRVRVRITGQKRGASFTDPLGTTRVKDDSPGRWTHFLFLDSDSVFDYTVTGEIRAEFDAEIIGAPRTGQAITTQVRELEDGEPIGCSHYVYLGSPMVTEIEPKPAKPAYNPGDKIRVAMDVEVQGYYGSGPFSCTTTQETDTENKRVHFLFVDSPRIKGITGVGNKRKLGQIVRAEFNGVIEGPIGGQSGGTTTVREFTVDGLSYTHALYLNSPRITPLIQSAGVISGTGTEAVTAPDPSKRGTTVSIDQYDEEITYSQVRDRIEDLSLAVSDTDYEVVRVRNDEVLAEFNDEDEAREYIEDNDYNPERVIVRGSEPDEDYVEELDNLGTLDSDCGSTFGLAWSRGEVTLYRNDFFDADWARNEASSELGLDYTADLNSWPLSLIDWDDAAEQRLSNDYEEISFDSETYFGRNV
jgi:hypothetical protein